MSEEVTEQPAAAGGEAVLGSEPAEQPAETTEKATEQPAAAEKPAEAAEAPAKEKPASEAKKGDEKPVEAKPEAKAKGEKADDKDADKLIWPEDGFPENWRERIIKAMGLEGDAEKKAKEVAKRSASPAELLRRVLASDSKIGELSQAAKERVLLPNAKGAKEDDIKAFDKAWGVPETPDKYDLTPLGEMSELDKELWDTVLPTFHKGKFSQAQVAEVATALKAAEGIAQKRMEDRAKAIDAEMEENLRVEYPGREYKANVELANRYLETLLGKHMGDKEERTSFLNMKLADGTRIGSYTPFVKAIIEAARDWSPEGLPEIGEGGQEIDPQARIKAITKLSHSQAPADKREYERLQPELHRLIAAQNRRNANGAAKR